MGCSCRQAVVFFFQGFFIHPHFSLMELLGIVQFDDLSRSNKGILT